MVTRGAGQSVCVDAFEKVLGKAEQRIMAKLTSPAKIQGFLDQA
jgi:hypothetical protein